MTEPIRDVLFCAAALLDRGRTVDRLSRPLTAAALLVLPFYAWAFSQQSVVLLWCLLLTAAAGIAESYFAIRVDFDAALFHRQASAPRTPDFAALDTALTRLGLLPAAKSGRPTDERVLGATRLLRLQILAVTVQVLCLLGGAAAGIKWH
jgi:hypothetical protein